MTPTQIERAAKLGICISTQAAFLYWKLEPEKYLESLIGKERIRNNTNLEMMVEWGITVGGGFDAPYSLPDPFLGIYAACNHPVAESSLSVLDAIKMHTAWASKLSFDEKERGTLSVGKRADFVLLGANPLEIDKQRIPQIPIEGLYLLGKPYQQTIKTPRNLLCSSLKHWFMKKGHCCVFYDICVVATNHPHREY